MKNESFIMNKEDMSYNDLIDVFNNSGEYFEGTHSVMNFVMNYYPEVFEAFEDIWNRDLEDLQTKADAKRPLKVLMEERYDFVRVEQEVAVSKEDMDTIMYTAIEKGIRYWCRKIEASGDCVGNSVDQHISKGGTLKLHDRDTGEIYMLTKNDLLRGISLWVKKPIGNGHIDYGNGRLRLVLKKGYCDGLMCDAIVQYAVFGKICRTLLNRTHERERLEYKYDEEETRPFGSPYRFYDGLYGRTKNEKS